MRSLGAYSLWHSAAKAVEADPDWRARVMALAFNDQATTDDAVHQLEAAIAAKDDLLAVHILWALYRLNLPEQYEAAALVMAVGSDIADALHWSSQAAWWLLTTTRRDRTRRFAAKKEP